MVGRRLASAAFLAALVLGLVGVPAQAQYGPPPPPPGPPAGCPVTNPPPANPPPCKPRRDASVDPDRARPGQQATVSVPDGTLAPGSNYRVVLTRVQPNSTDHVVVPSATADPDGSASSTFTVPALPPGVYLVWIHGVDSNGNPVVAMTGFVIQGVGTAAAAPVSSSSTPRPAAVEAALNSVSPDDVATVANGNGSLVVTPNGLLQVRGAQTDADPRFSRTGADLQGPMTAGMALLIAGGGLVLLRRRPGTSSR